MKPTISEEERIALRKLLSALKRFRFLNEKMPLQYVLSFLAVATEEGLGVRDYAQKLGVNNTTMSRHLLDIGPRNRAMEPGYNLIDYRPNPFELRKHEYYVTPRGRDLIEQLLKELGTPC